MAPVEPRRVQFGPFAFDALAGELYRGGERVRLQEQPRQVLEALLERPGEIVTRETLRERLWKTDTFVDFEHGLNTAIKKVRQALGDSAERPQFIETLSRRGYRFIAPVVATDSSAGAATVPSGSPELASRVASARRAGWLQIPLLVGAAGLVLVVALVVWTVSQAGAPGASPAKPGEVAQLAVMPFRVLGTSSEPDLSYLGIGIADTITTRLANIRQIALRPTAAVLAFKDLESDPSRAAAALGVQYVLVGTIQPAERTYRVGVQLVRADGVAIWGRTYDEARAGLLQLQDHLSEQVVMALRVELSPPERARLHRRYTENPAAYDLYLRGRALLVNYTEANMREAISHFERAIALEPSYALAHAGLATAAAWFSVRYMHDAGALTWGKRADHAARRALELDPALADAHLAIASAAGTQYGGFDWPTVLERTATALTLDPSLDLAHVVRMRTYYHLGLFDEAGREAQRARALNPTPNVEAARLDVVMNLFGGQYARAAEQATALLQQTEAPAARQYLGLARFYLGDVTAAREMLDSVKRDDRPDTRAQAALASVEAAAGLRDQARTRAAAVARSPDMDHHVAYSLGAAYAQLGDVVTSIKWLQQAADTGFPCYPWFERDPLLEPLRRDARFVRLVDKLRGAFDEMHISARSREGVR